MEIERRFLLHTQIDIDSIISMLSCKYIRQAYLYVDEHNASCVRVRIIEEYALLTIKKQKDKYSSYEFEYPIPYDDALYMMTAMRQGYIVEKKRYYYTTSQNLCFEIDVFMHENKGLILVEVELPYKNFTIELPDWIGEEITGISKYTNALLAQYPFCLW